jgi:hypothetical protein
MRFLGILLKILSILIAGVVTFFAIYDFPNWGPYGDLFSGVGNSIVNILTLIGWLVISLGFIWFAEHISEVLERYGWNPTWLVKITGWVILLIPVILLFLHYCKVIG